jgi:RNA polymerase sigma-70 factor (ECF subfamily)
METLVHTSTQNEIEQIAFARAGNSDVFTTLVEPYRKPLLVHCYRMSGSLDDAEDLVQETYLRAWGKIKSFEGQGSFRNWLYVIATRVWLDEVRKNKKQVLLPLDGDPDDPDSLPLLPASLGSWLDPLPDSWLSGVDSSPEFSCERRETISFAFMVALQKLNARQRVVLILREVFAWSAEDVANALGLSIDSVNNLLYRARKNLEFSQVEEPFVPKQNLDQFVNAWESGDINSLIQLLHEKATFAMPPMGVWYAGRDAIQRALQNFVFTPSVEWKLIPTKANEHPAFGIYQRTGDTKSYQVFGLILPIFNVEGKKVIEITAFLSPQLIDRFKLPQTVLP